MQEAYSAQGSHALLDCFDCPPALLADVQAIQDLLLKAAKQAGAHVIARHFHHFGEAQGVTGVLLLKESHMSIHTWPEQGFAAVDIFMCGQAQIEAAISCLSLGLQAKNTTLHRVQRG